MAQIPIPEQWRKKVCAALATEDRRFIEWTYDAELRYDADVTAIKMRAGSTDAAWRNEVYQPFQKFLSSSSSTGCLVEMRTPPGETYEFYFEFMGERFYGKILLRPDRKKIVIFSAHIPLKEKLQCE